MDIKAMGNIPTMSVTQCADLLAKSYSQIIKDGMPVKTMPSVMLWGPPGVGKSQCIRQISDLIVHYTGKQAPVTDVRLMLFNPIDLRGIPTANADKTLAVWLKPKIFNMDPSPNIVNILFLDELSAAPQSVQAAAYQITLDRVIGEHRLPDNCIVIAAGNRVTDKSVAFKMPRALANRLMHIEIEADFNSWSAWAAKSGIHPWVSGFVGFRRDLFLGTDVQNDDLAYPTPRSWEMVSNILNYVSPNIDHVFDLIAGLVGRGVAMEFRGYGDIYGSLPNIDDIFAGRTSVIPKNNDALYALTATMTAYARKYKDDFTKIQNSISYALGMPPEFSAILMRNYFSFEPDYKKKLMKLPNFSKWIQTVGKYL